MTKTVIIGGGIAGLATALLPARGRSQVDCTLIERSPHWGGKIISAQQDGFVVEGGPDSFITQKKTALDLCHRLGLSNQLEGSSTGKNSTTYVWSGGELHPMPEGMMLMAPTMVLPLPTPLARLISLAWKAAHGHGGDCSPVGRQPG